MKLPRTRAPFGYRWMLRSRVIIEWADRLLRRVTRNRIGVLDLAGLPSIRVTVPGRKTGIPRTCTLQVIPDRDALLVVESNWGRTTPAAWPANFLAAGQVTVQRGDQTFPASVRLLSGPERQRAWEKILVRWPAYQVAQDLAGAREFRLFALLQIAPADKQ